MKELWMLLITFAKVGVMTFGGGMAMLPILQREVVENRGWATEAELMDYYAVGQCTPGAIAINTAVFVGNKIRGIPGGVAAALGVAAPSLLIILAIALFIQSFSDLPAVQYAFAGIRVGVCVLIFNAVRKLQIINLSTLIICLVRNNLSINHTILYNILCLFCGNASDIFRLLRLIHPTFRFLRCLHAINVRLSVIKKNNGLISYNIRTS